LGRDPVASTPVLNPSTGKPIFETIRRDLRPEIPEAERFLTDERGAFLTDQNGERLERIRRDPMTGKTERVIFTATPAIDPVTREARFIIRDPGVIHWVQFLAQVGTEEQLRAFFLGSQEFFQRVGGTNEAYLQHLYWITLGREIDAGGAASWGRHLAA